MNSARNLFVCGNPGALIKIENELKTTATLKPFMKLPCVDEELKNLSDVIYNKLYNKLYEID